MRLTLAAAAAGVAVMTATWAVLAPPSTAAVMSAGVGFHTGGFRRGPWMGSPGFGHRPTHRARGRFGAGVVAYDGAGRVEGDQTHRALGLPADLVGGYADYYGDYGALPLVAPDYGYPSAFQSGQWPSDPAPAYYGVY